jgi:hypothetical protein
VTNENYLNDGPEKAAKKSAKDLRDKERKNKKNNKKKDEKSLPEYPVYKYSRPFLHEAIILEGMPAFISYAPKFDRILPFENIPEPPSRILRPPSRDEYSYMPYEFKDEEELERYLRRAKSETIDSLYQKAKSIAKQYNDQDDYKITLLVTDLIWSYFQDKFGTTHYLLVVGDNDSGKSSIGNSLEAVGYRVINMTSPTAANIFRVYGLIEPGQCVLILDEADKIDKDPDIMNILKSGYDYNKRVPKTNTNSWKVEFFYVYGLKVIIAEKSPSRLKAKGLLDRTLGFTVYPGYTDYDIKEVTAGNERNPRLDQALGELLDFRKLMLIYRLLHFEDSIPDIDVGVIRRNRELCKPYIRLFYGSVAQKEIEETFQIFLDTKNSKKAASIEATIIPVIIDMVNQKGREVASSEIWDFIKEQLQGESYGSDEYHISDHILYRNTITKLLEDKFGAEPKHTNKRNKVIFNPEKLRRIQRSYDIEIKIKTTLKGEGSEGCEGYVGSATPSNRGKTIDDFDNGNGKDEEFTRNGGSEAYPIPLAGTQEPSLPSHPSPIPIETELTDEEKAAMRERYDRLSAQSRRNWNAAIHAKEGDGNVDDHTAKPPSGVVG